MQEKGCWRPQQMETICIATRVRKPALAKREAEGETEGFYVLWELERGLNM
ncbi:Uncharacterized protein DAT39_012752 [Clarias magur]|uniref:Uncharacterized protein n=1 Tax=Clarias magur TaxID=1594786 RepID=A0A8J4TLS1_CLAMG|nr:Uncharacterized protein DAT39_012752 [Clarias magur]